MTPHLPYRSTLAVLIAIDLLLIGLHIALPWVPALGSDKRFSIETDRGFSEMVQAFKWASICALLLAAGIRARYWGYAAWALLFAYLLVDDWRSMHERWGVMLSRAWRFPTPPFIRAADLGELLVSAAAAAALLPGIALAWWRGSSAFRLASLDLVSLMLLLVAFGIGVDMLHAALLHRPVLEQVLAVVEDGGELLVASAIVAYCVALVHRGGPPGYGAWGARGLSLATSRRSVPGRAIH
jgi:hypothetical protein